MTENIVQLKGPVAFHTRTSKCLKKRNNRFWIKRQNGAEDRLQAAFLCLPARFFPFAFLSLFFFDSIGKKENKPVYELLGGRARPIDVYLSTGERHAPENRVEELLEMAEKGYKTATRRIKNNTLQEDIRDLEIISRGVDGKLHLGVDVNQGWLVSIVDQVPAWGLKSTRNCLKNTASDFLNSRNSA